jgi:hypothetical protein
MKLHYPPKYVLDEMQMYEVRSIMDYQYYANKDLWECARLIAYIIAQCNSTKKLKPTDIMNFYWELDEKADNSDTFISTADIQRLREKAKQYENKI